MTLPSSIEVGRSISMLMDSLECHRVARHVTVKMLDVRSVGYLVGAVVIVREYMLSGNASKTMLMMLSP